MAEERKDIKIDGHQATWDMRLDGNIKGTYAGTFRFRCFLNPIQTLAAGRDYREMLGEHISFSTQREQDLAFALAQLRQRIVSAPPFWSSQNNEIGTDGNLEDEEVIIMILDAALAAEIKYKNILKKRKEDAIKRAKQVGEQLLEKKADEKDESSDEEDSN